MEHRRIPDTDLEVSALCFGGGEFGTRARGAEAEALVAAFAEAGGNFYDTAHCYAFWAADGKGASERAFGDCLRRLGLWEKSVVATKGGHPDGGPDYPRPGRYLAPDIIASDIDDSLDRLGADSIALYYLHRDDSRVPAGEIIDALNREVERGRIRYLGASNWSVARIEEANRYAVDHGLRGFVISSVQWSLAVPTWEMGPDPTVRYVTDKDAAWYAKAGVPVAAYTSTASGYFASGAAGETFDTPDNRARAERARKLAKDLGATPTQVALAWLLHQKPTTIPIIGTLHLDHLREALAAVDVKLTPEQVRWLREG